MVEHISTGNAIGIDVGLKAYYTDSEGCTVENPRHYRKAEKRLKRLHKRLSRTQKKSKNRKKARQRLAKGYLKVPRTHKDPKAARRFCQKTGKRVGLISRCDCL
ncbi:MAG TPA: transposase [Ktedonobacteraceae bacterium]|nr:transposase [Ktedonobacteraceae bacterium]